MTARQKMEAAFSADGTPEIPAVICYEGICIRDHWAELTDCPWWYAHSGDLRHQVQWQRDATTKLGQDWWGARLALPRVDRQALRIEQQGAEVFRIDTRTGKEGRLKAPSVSGWWDPAEGSQRRPNPRIPEEVDQAIPLPPPFDPAKAIAEGRAELSRLIAEDFGRDRLPFAHVSSPLWSLTAIWDFPEFMILCAEQPELIERACRRQLDAAKTQVAKHACAGARAIWIEECQTDMISPAAYRRLCQPYLRQLTETIGNLGMKSIHYFCGDPAGKWDMLLDSGADAMALEESKKGFTIDIEHVVERVAGRMALLGNLDAMHLLAHGSERQLRDEISRQIAVGRMNRGRFIMSLGSPVTPETSIARVRLYTDLVHELGS